jgi:hypothetical protein
MPGRMHDPITALGTTPTCLHEENIPILIITSLHQAGPILIVIITRFKPGD